MQLEQLQHTMASRAIAFLNALSPEQSQHTVFPFSSSERFNWDYRPQQRTVTIIATRSLGDIVTDPVRGEMLKETVGLPLNQMSDAQRELAKTLLEEYVHNVTNELANAQLRRIHEAGLDKIHFAWRGS